MPKGGKKRRKEEKRKQVSGKVIIEDYNLALITCSSVSNEIFKNVLSCLLPVPLLSVCTHTHVWGCRVCMYMTVVAMVNLECHSSGAIHLCFWVSLSLLGWPVIPKDDGYSFNGFEGRDFSDIILKAGERPWGLVCSSYQCRLCGMRPLLPSVGNEGSDSSNLMKHR